MARSSMAGVRGSSCALAVFARWMHRACRSAARPPRAERCRRSRIWSGPAAPVPQSRAARRVRGQTEPGSPAAAPGRAPNARRWVRSGRATRLGPLPTGAEPNARQAGDGGGRSRLTAREMRRSRMSEDVQSRAGSAMQTVRRCFFLPSFSFHASSSSAGMKVPTSPQSSQARAS